MKHQLSAFIIALSLISSLYAQDGAADSTTEKKTSNTEVANPEALKLWQEFTNLPKEEREKFVIGINKVQNLFNQKRIFDALQKLDEVEKIFPNYPAALNIRGACYVEIRAFKKANKVFQDILKTSPNNPNVLFNLAEIDFVTKKWDSAHKRFKELIPILKPEQKAMIRLCEFKLFLCKLKLDRMDEAKALMDKYDLWDDSPFYYYSRAAMAYHKDEKLEAEKLLRGARYVWRNNAALSTWQDTLIEFGYIRSFYGGDAEEETP